MKRVSFMIRLNMFWPSVNTVSMVNFSPNRWCLLFTYLPLFEKELQELLADYNSHKIRKQRGKQRPDGVPDDMFHFPEMYGEFEYR